MTRKILVTLGLFILAIASGAGTYMILSTTMPEKTDIQTRDNQTTPDNSTKGTDTTTEKSTKQAPEPELTVSESNDQQLKADFNEITKQLAIYYTSNGYYPSSPEEIDAFNKENIGDIINTPANKAYQLTTEASDGMSQVLYTMPGECSADNLALTPTGATTSQTYAIATTLSDKSSYCVDS